MRKARSTRPCLALLCLATFLMAPASSLLAEDYACALPGLAAKTGLALDEIEISEPAHEPIFVDLGADLEVGDLLSFVVRVDGDVHLREDLELARNEPSEEASPSDATPVVELMAASNARLGYLYRQAQRSAVTVEIHRGGKLQEEVDFHDLLGRSEALRQEPIEPQAVVSTVHEKRAAELPLEKDACTDYCDDQQDDCYLYRCGQFGSASCYNACDQEWEDCLEGCGICSPSSSTSTSLSIVSTTYTGINECRHEFIFGSVRKGRYFVFDRRFKRTVTTTTTNADCTQTVTTSVTYFNIYCWSFWYQDNFCFSLGYVPQRC